VSAGCNGGPSEPIPGSAVRLIIGPAAVSLILGQLAPVFLPVAALIDGLAVELTTLCGRDPPPLPTWTADDLLILALGSESPAYQSTLTKIDDLVQNWAWDKSCQCTATVNPPPLVAPAPPPGASPISPTVTQPCFTGQYTGDPPINVDSATQHDLDVSKTTLSTDGRTRTGDTHSSSGIIYGIPAGTTQLTWQGFDPNTVSGPGSKGTYSFALWTFNSSGVPNVPVEIGPPSTTTGGTYTGSAPITSTMSYWLMIARKNDPGADTPLALPILNTSVWCGAASPGAQESCCPPDPSLTLGIQTIINLLQNMQHPPANAYTKGTVHSGLTGTGTLSVTGLFGLQIELTSGVPAQIQFPGVPPYERSVGWLSILTGDGMIDETRITRQHQVWASALAPYATQVGFQLNAGFSMTLTELLPL
jgi:hypothetical protein